MKKKIVSALMVAAMVVTAFAGCGSDKGGTSTQGGDKTSKSSGKVYMLNFKPETDEAWQNLAETYTDQTGVEVNVLTHDRRTVQHNITVRDGKVGCTYHLQCRKFFRKDRHGTIIHMI